MLVGKESVGVGRLQALLYLIANEAELIHLVAAVEPLPAAASSRHDLLIAILPSAQRLRRHAEHPGYCSDAVNAVGAVRATLHPATPPVMSVAEIVRYFHSRPPLSLNIIYTAVAHNQHLVLHFFYASQRSAVVTQTVASRQRASFALLASRNDPGVVPWLVGGSESYTGRLE